ncbi:MAG: cache domain-containing protein, partial [Candidatus Omnitrophica bacterium]|nr:cache domain-containing protein [Candidatus Omnitrophota bacterium]
METKHKRKTGIRRKVSVVICAASALIVVAGVLLSYVLGSRLLYRMKGQEYVQISQLLANYISQNLTGDIEDIKTYAARPLWLDFANESNLKHVSLDKEAILRQLNDMDKQWLDSSRDSALVRQYVDNRIGVSMCEILKVRRYVSELFITDKSGALIAASNKTSDFYQADEGWWQKAHSSGKGDIYVGSLEFDESADTWGIAIAAPMKDQDGEVIGVCKEFLSAQQIFKPLQDLRMGRTGHAAMVDGNGKILFHSGIKPFSDEFINSSGFKKLLSGRKAYGIIQNAHTHKQKMFTAFSKVESPFLAGNGITWLVFIDQDVTEMLSPLYFLLGSLMAIVGILLLVITIPVGYAFGGVFAKPIHELHLATEHVIAGDLDYKIETKTGDEIEQLADAFREMISNIKGKQRELQNIASSFEEKVKERTTELERVNEATLNILEDLTEAKNKLETLNRLKSDFVSTVSHELRTPLSITKEGISLVLDKIPGAINEKQETLLRVSLDNINRLARIINELLDISKIESGKITPKQKLVDMTGLIKEAVSFFELKAQEKQLKLKADLPDKPVYLYVDPDMMKQVFDNLIANALKFTEKGRIDILVKEDASKIECIVADTGVGISREDLPKAFQKFE